MFLKFLHRLNAVFLLALILVAGFTGTLQAEKYLGKNITIHRSGLKPVSGKVIQEVEGKRVWLMLESGIKVEISLNEPGTRVEVQKPIREQYDERKDLCKTAEDWYQLGKWCGQPDIALPVEETACFEKAIEVDPDHAGARDELGYIKKGGKWVLEEEEMKKRGFVQIPGGRWVKKEVADRIRAEKRGIIRGAGERMRESVGIPWALAKTLKSKNYILKCNSTEKVAERYLKVMEALHRAYSQVLGDFEPIYIDPGTIYIFRNQEEFMDITLQSRGVGGYFSPLDRKVRTYHGSFALTGNTDMVLAHEATHQFQHRIMKNWQAVPFWIIEAMAVYFGDGTRIRPAKVELNVIPRDRLQSLQGAIRGEYYVKLDTLLKLRPPFNIGPCYDHGWGIIFWLLQGNNPNYQYGHKGAGKRIWDHYLRHVATELEKLDVNGEARYFKDLILKEMAQEKKYKDIDEWEEDYKKFILNLPLEPLGTWKTATRWDGWDKIGIRLTFPSGMKRVPEEDLRQPYREAAAAYTDDGLRFWLSVYENMEQNPENVLPAVINGIFVSVDYDPEFQFEEVKKIKVNEFLDAAVSKFKAKFAKRRELAIALEDEEKNEKSSGGNRSTPTSRPKASFLPDYKVVNTVRVVLFSTPNRFYFLALAGPEAPFSKMDPKFDEALRSVRLNYEL